MRLALALFALVFVVHGSTLTHPFLFDDNGFIVNNSAIHAPPDLLKIWTSAEYGSSIPAHRSYRPFTTFLYSLAWIAGGGATWPFHVLKLLLHAAVCLLLASVWRRLWKAPGFFPERGPSTRFKWKGHDFTWTATPETAAVALAVVFAVHPANSEIVAYISATTSLLSGACYLAAYRLYLEFRENRRLRPLLGSYALFALSVLAMEEGITLVAQILLTELLLPAPEGGRSRRALGGYLLLAAGMGLLVKLMLVGTPDGSLGLGRWPYFLTQLRAYTRYLALLFWPWDLNADNLEFGFSYSLQDRRVLLALFANLMLLGWTWAMRRRYPVFLFSLLWFYIALSPTSSVVVLAEPVNDRRMYLAYFGLVGAALPFALAGLESATRFARPLALSPASGTIAALALAALVCGTVMRNRAWSSPEALWTDTVEKNPKSGRAINRLLLLYMAQGNWGECFRLLDRCDQVAPGYPHCKTNRAIVLKSVGRDAEADQVFRDSIAVDISPDSKFFYADFLESRDRLAEALQLYREIDMATAGTNLDAKLGWARLTEKLGHPVEAKAILDSARAKFGDHPKIPR